MDYLPGALTGVRGQASPRGSNVMKGCNICWRIICLPTWFKVANRKWVRYATCNSTSPTRNDLEGDEDTPPKPPKSCDEKKSDDTTPPPVSAAAKGVDKMAEEIQKQLEANKGENKETQATKPGNQKGKAPKATKKTGAAKTSSKDSKAFPGTRAAAPKHFENATIYTCPNSSPFLEEGGAKKSLGKSHGIHGNFVNTLNALHEARPWGNNGEPA